MQSMTLEQLRTVSNSGGVSHVTLSGEGGAFLVKIATLSGEEVFLAKARSTEPRRFGNPASALNTLREVGITLGQFDSTYWDPSAREPVARASDRRAQGLRAAHEAAAFNASLAVDIQQAIDDPRPSIPHEEVMERMAARIKRHKTVAGSES